MLMTVEIYSVFKNQGIKSMKSNPSFFSFKPMSTFFFISRFVSSLKHMQDYPVNAHFKDLHLAGYTYKGICFGFISIKHFNAVVLTKKLYANLDLDS